MADLNSSAGADRHKGFASSKKLSTRVDLTPMVDLGFLLITFFIFTTNMSKPRSMDLIMPADGRGITVGESTALTIIPSANNNIFYYHGDLDKAIKEGSFGYTNYSLGTGVGNIIRAKQMAMDKSKPGFRNELMLIIKPAEDSKYKNVVDILDEVLINAVKHYAIVTITKEESVALGNPYQ